MEQNNKGESKKKFLRKFISFILIAALTFLGMNFSQAATKVSAAANEYKFDFGAGGVQSGFIGVSAATKYSSKLGYGFNEPNNMSNVSASGRGELSDAVQFKSTNDSNTFNVDLSNGLYEVTVYLGNTFRTSIWAEGCLQVINMTGNNAVATFKVPITDGQLNIRATAGKSGTAFTMSALKVKKISNNAVLPKTIWVCGDSTVCDYYPLDSSKQAGWGQMLKNHIDTNVWQVRNMASSGQYAKGFVNGGQFAAIEKYGKKGDIYFISIGINDTNYSNATEYYNTVKSMAQKAMSKGMKVILVKQQGRSGDISRKPLLTGRWFGGELDKIGSELNIQVVDLFNLAQNYFLSIGQDATNKLYMDGDTLHPNRQGADVLAKLVAGQVDFNSSDNGNTGNNNSNLYYAVDASYEQGVFENTNKGYSGKGYVNLNNNVGSNITWKVNVKKSGNYLVTFRIANGSNNDRAMKIEVNNGKDYWLQSFRTTGSWTNWQERGIVLPLKAGDNIIKATSNTNEGGPNIDYIKLEETDEPIAETYTGNNNTNPNVGSGSTIYIAGDSTAQSYRASYAPQQGWGYYLGNYFKDNKINVVNNAIAGRSSKSFYDNGRLDTILNSIKKGDYLLVQFGINDSAANKSERYAPVCGSVANAKEGSFEYYIKKYVEGAKAHNATPVLMSPTLGLKSYSNGKFVNSYGSYAKAMKDIAAYYKIPYIDLNTLMVQHYNSIGYNAASKYHLCGVVSGSNDATHFSEAGANKVAELIADAFKKTVLANGNNNNNNSGVSAISSGSYYRIKNVNSGLYLNAASDILGANVMQSSSSNTNSQIWYVVNSGENGYYNLACQIGDGLKVLDVENGLNEDGANIQLWGYGNSKNQKFNIKNNGDGTFSILTGISSDSKCLDVAANSKNDGANVLQYKYRGTNNQKWVFEKVNNFNGQNKINPSKVNDNTTNNNNTSNNKLKLTYDINNWGTGYQINFKISNSSNKAVNTWTLKIKKSDINVNSSFNVNIKESGDYYVITPVSWNSTIGAGNSIDFGIQGVGSANKNLHYVLS